MATCVLASPRPNAAAAAAAAANDAVPVARRGQADTAV